MEGGFKIMKKGFYKLFKPAVYSRASTLKLKQVNRVNRLKSVIKELNEWSDIPISWQLNGLCKILKIVPNKPARDFLYDLTFRDVDIENEARKLPLI